MYIYICMYVGVMCVYTFGGVRLGVWVMNVMVCCTYIDEHELVYVRQRERKRETMFLVYTLVYVYWGGVISRSCLSSII